MHPQKAFFKQPADLALSVLDKVAERPGGVFWTQRWGKGGAEVDGEATVPLDMDVVEEAEVLAVMLGGWHGWEGAARYKED